MSKHAASGNKGNRKLMRARSKPINIGWTIPATMTTIMPDGTIVDVDTDYSETTTGPPHERPEFLPDRIHCFPLESNLVPIIYKVMVNSRHQDIRMHMASTHDMPTKPAKVKDVQAWLTKDTSVYRDIRCPTSCIHIHMAARLFIGDLDSNMDALEAAAKRTTPLTIAVRGFEQLMASAIEHLHLAISPVSVIMALLINPITLQKNNEAVDPRRMLKRAVNCTVSALGDSFWQQLCSGIGPEDPTSQSVITSREHLIAALGYMAWDPSGRYYDGVIPHQPTYWQRYHANQVKIQMNATGDAGKASREAAADTTLHALHYILANWLSSTSDEYDFSPDDFFGDVAWVDVWLRSMGFLY